MAAKSISIIAPARLHFGLLSFGDADERQFGGTGLMLDEPALHLYIESADTLIIDADKALRHRIELFAKQWQGYHDIQDELRCRIQLIRSPRQHTGLGLGTQLGLSVIEALNRLHEFPTLGPSERATIASRAKRSAVGTFGFQYGGFIVERGRVSSEPISSIDCRLDFPLDWRILLIQPQSGIGLSGPRESDAFQSAPVVPKDTTEQLIGLIRDHIIPAITARDFNSFSSSISKYGNIAGSCFSSIQGGPYNGPELNERVNWLLQHGARGVGQSSWGPTLFSFFESSEDANEFVQTLPQDTANPLSLTVVQANNEGARITVSNDTST
tara:strand:- start:409 stop:1389 length:981 start_codon:yes stop_codon:yes gene_type:complete